MSAPIPGAVVDAELPPAFNPITVTFSDGGWAVFQGPLYCDRLCWDEMLGQVVHLTHPQIMAARYPMLTAGEHAQRVALSEERQRQNCERWAAEDQAKRDAITAMTDALRQWAQAERDDDGREFSNAQAARDAALDCASKLGLA